MPFIFDIGPPSNVYRGSDHFGTDFVLGYDTDSYDRILMSVVLFEADSNEAGEVYELAFGIRFQDLYSGIASEFFFDHATARKFVDRHRAEVVLLLIMRCIGALIEQVLPTQIAMETWESKLPAEAMGKYMRVISKLGLLGFGMTNYRRDATDFKDYWFFSK